MSHLTRASLTYQRTQQTRQALVDLLTEEIADTNRTIIDILALCSATDANNPIHIINNALAHAMEPLPSNEQK